ncbi:metal-dependent hydrolase [Saccharopolyspora taberi]|uniref:Metal-dependent hydrolase n=1 Tax=Saccharopolyspora taberi TaxID=60895 RepID=A0ABN3VEX7_9PSEU
MGRSHALSGWCAGLAVAGSLGQHHPAGKLVLATVTAGFALLPDLDHRGSTASRLLGPVTAAVSWLVRTIAVVIYRYTAGPRDEPVSGEHRTFWHSGVAAGLLGLAAGYGTAAGGHLVVLGVLVTGVLLAVAALGDWVLLPAGFALVAAFVQGPQAVLDDVAGWPIGVVVAVGCVVHDLGDMLTKSGCPLLWPVPIAGETFFELRPPSWLRFRTGGPVENIVVFPALAVAAVLLVPGVWPVVSTLFTRLGAVA